MDLFVTFLDFQCALVPLCDPNAYYNTRQIFAVRVWETDIQVACSCFLYFWFLSPLPFSSKPTTNATNPVGSCADISS